MFCIGFIAISIHLEGINTLTTNRFALRPESPDRLPVISSTLNIPASTGPLYIDGKLDDVFWKIGRASCRERV